MRVVSRAVLAAALLATLAGLGATASRAAPRTVHLVILHTNDMHGQALPLGRGDKARGGFAALARTIARERANAKESGCETLLVDAGDMWVGPPEGSRTEGKFVAEVMNELRYDVATVGNHEFDAGPAKVALLASWVKFPLLGANVKDMKTHEVPSWLKPSVVIQRGGVSVRFVGLVTSKIHEVTTPAATVGLEFEDEAKTLEATLGAEPKGDLTIAITHCGHEVDKHLAKKFHGKLAAIVGGHSHRPLDPAWRIPEDADDPVLVVQTGSRTANLGRIDLDFDPETKTVVKITGKLIPVKTDDEDAAIKAMVQAEVDECNKLLGVKIGSTPEALVRAPRSISNLGSVICDVMREAGGVDLAFTNPRGLRADIPAGDVLLRNIYEVDPFGNTLIKMKFKGSELRALLEEMCTKEPLDSSGLELRYDSKRAKGQRIVEAKVGGEPLDDAKTYSVATNNFLAAGGDTYEEFKKGSSVEDTGVQVRDHVRRHFEKAGEIKIPVYKGRIVNVAKERDKE